MHAEALEYLRRKMVMTSEEHGSFTHPDVVAISQQLDLYIVQAQKGGSASSFDAKRSISARNVLLALKSKYTRALPTISVRRRLQSSEA